MPELQTVLGDEIHKKLISCDESNEMSCIKDAFQQLMECDSVLIEENLNKALYRLESQGFF